MTTNEERARTIDRRRFVTLAGAGTGLALAGPLLSPRAARAAGGIRIKVGVLTSTGSSYAKMGPSLLDGLRLGFAQARSGPAPVQATLVTGTVDRGFGGATSAAQSLLDRGADVVVADVSALVAPLLAPIFAEQRTPLVLAGVGAHVVQPAARNGYVLYNSLLYWQASYAAGRWAAGHLGKRAFVASALADSGYDTIYAFRQGFESAGGSIVGDAVTHVQPGDTGLAQLFSELGDSGADVLYGLYSGSSAVQLVQAHASSGVAARLVAGNLAVEDYMLPEIGAASVGALSCASWTRTRSAGANASFSAAFGSRFGRAPDPFAALGYDTAALVAHGARRALGNGHGPRRLVHALDGASIEGPRGKLTVVGATNAVVGPLWMREVKRSAGGRLVNADVANAPSVGSFPSSLSPLASGTVGGYLNEYLCA